MSTPAPAPTWLQLDERDDHYLGLAGANVVATQALLSLHENLADVVEQRAMMCVHGDAGLGKTLSVNAALRALAPAEVCRVQFRARPTPRDIRHVLFDALGIGGGPPTRPIEFDTLLKDVLAERFRVLVCDEAQWLSRECFELWRHLWDDRRTQIAIVFVGGGDCYRVLRREPMLSSRVYVWQEFRRLTREQVLCHHPGLPPGLGRRTAGGHRLHRRPGRARQLPGLVEDHLPRRDRPGPPRARRRGPRRPAVGVAPAQRQQCLTSPTRLTGLAGRWCGCCWIRVTRCG